MENITPKQIVKNMSNQEAIEFAVKTILYAIGENPNREGLKETPKRVAKMYFEIFESVVKTDTEIMQEFAKFFKDDDDGNDDVDKFGDMVIVKNIPFYSMCEHHLVPFFGKAHVGYIPKDKVIGISKIARLVDAISKRPQLQERITNSIAEMLDELLNPIGVMVVLEAQHMCMTMRGVKKPGSITVTSAARGAFKEDMNTRQEFLNLIKG